MSKAAISLVLNGKARQHGISEQLEQRILEFCREINYRPNIHAQRMNRRRVNNIGILLQERVHPEESTPLGDYNVSHIIGGVALAADQAGCRFMVQIFRQGMDESRVFDWFENREIDGLIYYGFGMPGHWLERFKNEKRKVVGVSIDPAHGVPCVNVDNFGGSLAVAEHLIWQGRRKMLYLSGNPESYPGQERLRGFRAAMERHGLGGCGECENANYDAGLAENIVRRRFAAGVAFDAVVCGNDDMAVGALNALRSLNIAVPGLVAVAGADNTRVGRFVTPALTSFDYRTEEQGRAAFELLRRIINEPSPQVENIILDTELIVRAST